MERKSPVFGSVSTVCAFATLVVPFVLFIGMLITADPNDPRNEGWGWFGRVIAGFALSVAVAILSGLIGAVSAIVGFVRRERLPWLGVVGLIVNGAVIVLLVVGYISNMNTG